MILQDRTTNILKNDKIADQIFVEFEQLIDSCMDKFESDTFVHCELPPLKYKLENVSKKYNPTDEFNCLLSSKYNNHASVILLSID